MKKKSILREMLEKVKPENRFFVNIAMDITNQVRHYISLDTNISSQKDLAQKLGKEDSEISKWLSGMHNITLESISKMSAVFNKDIVMTELRAREMFEKEYKLLLEKQTNEINELKNRINTLQLELSLSNILVKTYNTADNNWEIPYQSGENYSSKGLNSNTTVAQA